MGGIVKSTLATAYFHEVRADFDGRSFLSNVKEACERKRKWHRGFAKAAAFRYFSNEPPDEYKELSERAVHCAEYLPLASSSECQRIFLDIACFFKGHDRDDIIPILNGCGFNSKDGIDYLVGRSLLEIRHGKILWMRDLLQQMGRDIVRRESSKPGGRPSRIWDVNEFMRILGKKTGLEKVEAIVVNFEKESRISRFVALSNMEDLRLLKILGSFSFQAETDKSHAFTAHLRRALSRKGIFYAFNEECELERGVDIFQGLMVAIQRSQISVVVLSENYAFSRWCLRELCKIVECMDTSGLVVVPIFYHVNPSDVRKLDGSFRDAFIYHEHYRQHDFEEVETWKDALKRVGNLPGWTLGDM
ncbi:hypothetical protein FNV43_RR08514 [Rhamnella rubrinervis]|uniref:TIR domain-containing protein n=1 Tax=Rhamnella rubrinervis TaxID=2594499 RepID=A0A8K0H9C2_9ROSA|nr:hypothetical protein FNV43_RR08514 [Rhamnella rubrinervis]